MKKIEDFLSHLGLTEAEGKLYFRLLEIGQCSVTQLAQSLNMNRVTAHFNIQNLIIKGLITHIKRGKERELTAQPPQTLKYLVEKKQRQADEVKREFDSVLPLLVSSMPSKDRSKEKFDVKFYEGKNGVRAIYREALKAKELRSYVNISSIFENFPENPQLFPDAVSRKHLTMWEITEDSARSREYLKTVDPKKYFHKFFPAEWNMSVFDYMIFEGRIAMISASGEEIDGILITNESIYQNAKSIFELLWKLIPDVR